MSHDDADPDDDAGLASLRAAWRSMPDEEPPARGLAELMAAARVKAEEMAPAAEPWWQRALAMLRRPQVLALATIVLVAGGVVLVGRHREDIETPAPAVQAPAAPTGQTELERAEEKDKGRDVAPTATGTATATPPPIEAPVTTPPTTRPQRPHQQAKSGGAATVGGKSEPKAQETRREVNQTEGEAQVQEAPVAADAIEQAPTSAQLYARARAAAAAGDCATARSLVAQVQRSDAEYYKAHVASDTSLAACE